MCSPSDNFQKVNVWSENDMVDLLLAYKTVSLEDCMDQVLEDSEGNWKGKVQVKADNYKWKRVAECMETCLMKSEERFPELCQEKFQELHQMILLQPSNKAAAGSFCSGKVKQLMIECIKDSPSDSATFHRDLCSLDRQKLNNDGNGDSDLISRSLNSESARDPDLGQHDQLQTDAEMAFLSDQILQELWQESQAATEDNTTEEMKKIETLISRSIKKVLEERYDLLWTRLCADMETAIQDYLTVQLNALEKKMTVSLNKIGRKISHLERQLEQTTGNPERNRADGNSEDRLWLNKRQRRLYALLP